MAIQIDADQAAFERIAAAVVERATDLFGGRVTVNDDRDIVVASNDPELVGQSLSDFAHEARGDSIRVPLRLDGYVGEVVVAETVDGEVVSPRLARALVDLIVDQVTVVDRLPHQHELKNRFIYDVLHGSGRDDAALLREAKLLGMDLEPPRAVVLIDAADYILAARDGDGGANEAEIARRALVVTGSIVGFFQLPNATICAYLGGGEVAVLKASNTRNLATWVDDAAELEREREQAGASWANLAALKRAARALATRLRADTRVHVSVGVGRYHPGLRGLAMSYADARAALSLGRRVCGQSGVHCLDELGVAAFVGLADEQTKVDLAQHLLSPLDHEPDLLATLAGFFAANCVPSVAATEIGVHRNTLAYRLDKIASLTGLDPRRFDDAVQIRLALVLRAL